MTKSDQVVAHHLAGLTNLEIEREMPSLSISSIRTYLSRARREFTQEQKDQVEANRRARVGSERVVSRSFATRRVLSPMHAMIGWKVLCYRQRERLSLDEFVERMPFANRVTLSAIEQGFHDFKLSELITISKMLDLSVADLTNPPGATSG